MNTWIRPEILSIANATWLIENTGGKIISGNVKERYIIYHLPLETEKVEEHFLSKNFKSMTNLSVMTVEWLQLPYPSFLRRHIPTTEIPYSARVWSTWEEVKQQLETIRGSQTRKAKIMPGRKLRIGFRGLQLPRFYQKWLKRPEGVGS